MNMKLKSILVTLLALILLAGCSKTNETSTPKYDSWETLPDNVWESLSLSIPYEEDNEAIYKEYLKHYQVLDTLNSNTVIVF